MLENKVQEQNLAAEVDIAINPLLQMFLKQSSLQEMACGAKLPADMPDQFYLHATACMVELAEAIQNDSRWKHMIGGKRKPEVNHSDKLEELVDAMHFLLNAVLYSGFSYSEFVKAFFDKGKVNVARQQAST